MYRWEDLHLPTLHLLSTLHVTRVVFLVFKTGDRVINSYFKMQSDTRVYLVIARLNGLIN